MRRKCPSDRIQAAIRAHYLPEMVTARMRSANLCKLKIQTFLGFGLLHECSEIQLFV